MSLILIHCAISAGYEIKELRKGSKSLHDGVFLGRSQAHIVSQITDQYRRA